jgi:two-component system, OmpR family, response regulator
MSDRKYRILIVDDEESIRRSLRAYLEDEGFDVVATGTGEVGLEVLSAGPAHAVIVDMRLPGMDGNTFIEKALLLHPQMNVFIFTGSVGYLLPANLQTIGVGEERVFNKPLRDMSLLVNALRALIDVRREG